MTIRYVKGIGGSFEKQLIRMEKSRLIKGIYHSAQEFAGGNLNNKQFKNSVDEVVTSEYNIDDNNCLLYGAATLGLEISKDGTCKTYELEN